MENAVVEGYIGEYASGKSENAINRAVELARMGRKVTLVDLDLVEPFYTLRPLKKTLKERGIEVIAWETKEATGLGEAGSLLRADMRWALKREGDIILDIGYGIEGMKILKLVHGAEEHPHLRIYAVVNACRPLTHTVEEIVEYVQGLGRVDGLINNTHLGEKTTLEVIREGAEIVNAAAKRLSIPLIATSVEEKWKELLGDYDHLGHPIRYLHRYMPKAIW